MWSLADPEKSPKGRGVERSGIFPASFMVSNSNEKVTEVSCRRSRIMTTVLKRAEWQSHLVAEHRRKLSVSLLPISCMAQLVLGCTVLICNIFFSQTWYRLRYRLQLSDRTARERAKEWKSLFAFFGSRQAYGSDVYSTEDRLCLTMCKLSPMVMLWIARRGHHWNESQLAASWRTGIGVATGSHTGAKVEAQGL